MNPEARNLLLRVAQVMVEELSKNIPSTHAPTGKYPVNLDVFRAESKHNSDERLIKAQGQGLTVTTEVTDVKYPHVNMTVSNDASGDSKTVFLPYSHGAMAKLLTEYGFTSVLEIGSRAGAAAELFNFCGKEVDTVEISGDYPSKYQGDFVRIDFDKQFDCVWCSHVLEHQRNVGQFLDKIFEVTKEGGLVVISVPCAISPILVGHPTIFTPAHLVYQLVCAGFDCRNVSFKIYDWQISLILQKVSSGATQSPIGMYPDGEFGSFNKMYEMFPPVIAEGLAKEFAAWGEIESCNWDIAAG